MTFHPPSPLAPSQRPKAPMAAIGLLLTTLVTAPTLQARQPTAAPAPPILSNHDIQHPVVARQGMVATQKSEATQVGVEILRRGGNAVDAAVAVGLALAVVLPRAGNLGGGGFMLVHDAKSGETFALDYREKAPAAAHRDMFLTEDGQVHPERSSFSHQAAGVPGTVAGLAYALEHWGTLSLEEVIAPAVRLAEEGFEITPDLAANLRTKRPLFERFDSTQAIFLKPDGANYQVGERLIQKDLAWSLQQIAEHGADAFYRGAIAKKLVADMQRHDGLIDLDDLAGYRVTLRQPLTGHYRGYTIAAMPPPSSGGVHLIQMLNVLEAYPLAAWGHNSSDVVHRMAETMKMAYADRSQHLGDPDFWQVPVDGLVSKAYAAQQRSQIDPYRARPSTAISAGDPAAYESPDTTHFSIIDRHGNAVSNTYTLNFSYGSSIVAEGTGILLNNEMDDFSAKPGVPNAYGLVGGEANAVEAGKRPLSSMTPTLVFDDDGVFLATGSPGGSRIITTVLQILLNVIDFDMNIAEATHALRVHHQWLPDELRVEKGLSPDTKRLLSSRGHRVVEKAAMGATQSIQRRDGLLFGATDPRRPDGEAAGY